MSAPNIYNIPLSDDDPAPEDKVAVSPRVAVLKKSKYKPRSPEWSSTPTTSASRSSSTSGINSVSRSPDSDITDSSAYRRRLRPRRGEATSSTVNYENYEDRAYASLPTSPQDAEDSEDSQSEPTPLEGGSVDIPMAGDGDAEDDNRIEREVDNRIEREVNDECFVKFLIIFIICGVVFLAGFSIVFLVITWFHPGWYKVVPQIPKGVASKTTEVIDTDANMDMD